MKKIIVIFAFIFAYMQINAQNNWVNSVIKSPDGNAATVNDSSELQVILGTNALNELLSSPGFYERVALGLVHGVTYVNKFGHNAAVAITGEDVWSLGGTYAFYPTVAQSMEVLSTDADDDDGDTGANSVIVFGLDENWEVQSETVTLNGLAGVNLVNTYIRMYRAFVYVAGSSNTNEGNITVRIQGGGTSAIYISAEDGQTQQAIFTTPNNSTSIFIKGYVATADDDKNGEVAEFKWLARANNGVNGAWLTKGQVGLNTLGSSSWQYKYGVPAGGIPGRTDIRVNCFSATAEIGVVGGFDILIFDNTIFGLN